MHISYVSRKALVYLPNLRRTTLAIK